MKQSPTDSRARRQVGAASDAFVIDVRESDNALDIFHHPYAHATWRGIETRAGGDGPALVSLLAA